jgi:hypothetical protein
MMGQCCEGRRGRSSCWWRAHPSAKNGFLTTRWQTDEEKLMKQVMMCQLSWCISSLMRRKLWRHVAAYHAARWACESTGCSLPEAYAAVKCVLSSKCMGGRCWRGGSRGQARALRSSQASYDEIGMCAVRGSDGHLTDLL